MCIYFHFPVSVLHLLRVVVSRSLIVPECQSLISVYSGSSQPCLGIWIPFEIKKKKNSGVWALPKTYWKQIFRGEA